MENKTISGLPRLSRDFNRGYTKAIQDLIDIFGYIQPDLRYHHKILNGKLAIKLLKCCLENRVNLRDREDMFIRFNTRMQDFECVKEKK